MFLTLRDENSDSVVGLKVKKIRRKQFAMKKIKMNKLLELLISLYYKCHVNPKEIPMEYG